MINTNLPTDISVVPFSNRIARLTCRPPDFTDCLTRCTRSGGPNSRRACSASLRLSIAASISSSMILHGAQLALSRYLGEYGILIMKVCQICDRYCCRQQRSLSGNAIACSQQCYTNGGDVFESLPAQALRKLSASRSKA